MARITYIEHCGKTHVVEVRTGISVMKGAVQNNIPGIDAECGGQCSCGTCHVYVDEVWGSKLGPAGDGERALLEFVSEAAPNSRLSCQIAVTDVLYGLVVTMPGTQG